MTLPSEAEWENAARGKGSRIYPWGNTPDPDVANYGSTGIETTSTVGCFPSGASSYKVEELSGNVLEWPRSLWAEYPYPSERVARIKREDLQAPEDMSSVLWRGAFWLASQDIRCAYRNGFVACYTYDFIGFRVALAGLP